MSDEQKPGDPADKAIDAKADAAFGGAVSHRGGYGGIQFEGQTFTKLEWVERTARTGGTLAAGEGRLLLAEIDRLRRILAVLREPSEAVRTATFAAINARATTNGVIGAAVAAAEQEVGCE